MKKPKNFELKKWLTRSIVGIRVIYRQTGTETAETLWELTDAEGEKRTALAGTLRPLLKLEPNHWCRIARIKEEVDDEVHAWEQFEKANASEYAEYKRLKAKFEKADHE